MKKGKKISPPSKPFPGRRHQRHPRATASCCLPPRHG
jgi:hypothetical protein